MNIERKLVNASEVDIFSDLSREEKMETDMLAYIALKIHERRIEMGMSQTEFAKMNKVSQAMVSKWESGEYNFTIQALAKIFANIGLNLSFDIEDKKETFVVQNIDSDFEQNEKWRVKTTSSGIWSRKTVSQTVYACDTY